jgi:preprotein translocase subunit SecA
MTEMSVPPGSPADPRIFGPPSLRRRFQQLRGGTIESDLRPFAGALDAISKAAREAAAKSDEELSAAGRALRAKVAGGAAERDVLQDAFALVSEAAFRRLGLRLFDVQILAGLALHQGRIVEMQTGEGKTLAAVAPAFLSALAGRGVHVLTANDYLAKRDARWMGPVYESLGLRVGFVQERMTRAERRAAYRCDVTYVTAREAGFDYLRDHLCLDPDDLVHRPLHVAIVDEADSILVDEARVPLVVAGDEEQHASAIGRMAGIARRLTAGVDYDTDEYARNINLTERGSLRVEEMLGCGNLFAPENLATLAQIRNALHAEALLRRDVDYIVRNGRVELVDELTGRVVDKRQWPDGLQAALEAKEGQDLQPEGRILGSIPVQHFVRNYPRLAGMTATAQSAAAEFHEVYGIGVTVIPTHMPCVRVDHADLLFTDRAAKERAIVDEIASAHATGRPILVGTASVAESERLALTLVASGVPCRVLNAKNDEVEAEIVAEAGAAGAVTISTNMAGRGTDIRLGGRTGSGRAQVVALGGLYVIGTNRHESRRIDDQLRGRAGRQGDPGSSRFIVSLEDDLLQRFGLRGLIRASRWPAPQSAPLDDALLTSEIARAQRIVDGQNFEARQTLWRYSQVLEGQRQHIQEGRQTVLLGEDDGGVLALRRPERWQALTITAGAEVLRQVERRLTLVAIDRCWSDHLAEISRIRDGIHLVTLGGLDPYEQYHARAREAFEETVGRIDDEIVRIFDGIEITRQGVDWRKAGLLGPSSTWTYLVTDKPFTTDPLASLSARPSLGLPLALAYGPLFILWGIFSRWRRARKRKPPSKGNLSCF